MNIDVTKIGAVNKENKVSETQCNCVSNPIKNNDKCSYMSSVTSAALRSNVLGGFSFANKQRLLNLQEIFRNVFLNNDISVGEAKIMADRYKQLEKIKDKDEYIKAVFEEAKSNFGFGSANIKLKIKEPDEMQGAFGTSDNAFCYVCINKDTPRSHIINTIHHEFRHMKQNQMAYSYSPQKYMDAINKKIEIISNGKVQNKWQNLNKFKAWIDSNLNGSKLSEVNEEFAKKVLLAISTYKPASQNYDVYRNSFVESDARKAGSEIEFILRHY